MIDLYNTITDASGVTRAKNPFGAHVVRSFLEKDASINEFFFFNISALEGTETVLEAELHLFRMDTPRAQLHPSLYLNPFYVLSLYQVIDPAKLNVPDLHKLLAVHYVPALGSGWQVFNVKKVWDNHEIIENFIWKLNTEMPRFLFNGYDWNDSQVRRLSSVILAERRGSLLWIIFYTRNMWTIEYKNSFYY